jgi:hypothetical protein
MTRSSVKALVATLLWAGCGSLATSKQHDYSFDTRSSNRNRTVRNLRTQATGGQDVRSKEKMLDYKLMRGVEDQAFFDRILEGEIGSFPVLVGSDSQLNGEPEGGPGSEKPASAAETSSTCPARVSEFMVGTSRIELLQPS